MGRHYIGGKGRSPKETPPTAVKMYPKVTCICGKEYNLQAFASLGLFVYHCPCGRSIKWAVSGRVSIEEVIKDDDN